MKNNSLQLWSPETPLGEHLRPLSHWLNAMYSIVLVMSISCLCQGDGFDKDGGEMDSMDSIPQRRHVWLLETLDISRFM